MPIFPMYSLPCSLQLVDRVEEEGLQNDRSADALPRLVEYEGPQRQVVCQKWRQHLPCLKEQKQLQERVCTFSFRHISM